MYDFDEIIDRKNTNCIKWGKVDDDQLPLWIADMDFKCPKEVSEALKKRAEHPIYGYSYPTEESYDLIINWYKKRHDCIINKEDIVLNTGVVYALYLIVNLFVKEDEKVIIQPPVYPPFNRVPTTLNREVVFNPLIKKDDKWFIDFCGFEQCLKNDEKISLYILCNPHNPIGTCYSLEEIEKLAEICQKYNVLMVSDEIHSDIIMPNSKHTSSLKMDSKYLDNLIVLSSATKTFNLAGLKISYAIIKNEKLRQIFTKQAEESGLTAVNLFSLEAMNAAYKYGKNWLDELNDYIYQNHLFLKDYLTNNLPQISYNVPQATYLAWLDFSKYDINEDVNTFLKNTAKVVLNPGSGFYSQCEKYQRLNVACPRSILKEALDRITSALNQL